MRRGRRRAGRSRPCAELLAVTVAGRRFRDRRQGLNDRVWLSRPRGVGRAGFSQTPVETSRAAVAARAAQNDVVRGQLVPPPAGNATERLLERRVLERLDLAAVTADEVVVMVAARVDALEAGDRRLRGLPAAPGRARPTLRARDRRWRSRLVARPREPRRGSPAPDRQQSCRPRNSTTTRRAPPLRPLSERMRESAPSIHASLIKIMIPVLKDVLRWPARATVAAALLACCARRLRREPTQPRELASRRRGLLSARMGGRADRRRGNGGGEPHPARRRAARRRALAARRRDRSRCSPRPLRGRRVPAGGRGRRVGARRSVVRRPRRRHEIRMCGSTRPVSR